MRSELRDLHSGVLEVNATVDGSDRLAHADPCERSTGEVLCGLEHSGLFVLAQPPHESAKLALQGVLAAACSVSSNAWHSQIANAGSSRRKLRRDDCLTPSQLVLGVRFDVREQRFHELTTQTLGSFWERLRDSRAFQPRTERTHAFFRVPLEKPAILTVAHISYGETWALQSSRSSSRATIKAG